MRWKRKERVIYRSGAKRTRKKFAIIPKYLVNEKTHVWLEHYYREEKFSPFNTYDYNTAVAQYERGNKVSWRRFLGTWNTVREGTLEEEFLEQI